MIQTKRSEDISGKMRTEYFYHKVWTVRTFLRLQPVRLQSGLFFNQVGKDQGREMVRTVEGISLHHGTKM